MAPMASTVPLHTATAAWKRVIEAVGRQIVATFRLLTTGLGGELTAEYKLTYEGREVYYTYAHL